HPVVEPDLAAEPIDLSEQRSRDRMRAPFGDRPTDRMSGDRQDEREGGCPGQIERQHRVSCGAGQKGASLGRFEALRETLHGKESISREPEA
ncbi:hypothetical protein, partial [Thermoanaerobacterium sp. DL9XJH110]|uniref:hypothetical protein n=1 Tax=Thermoanaerobacterium sp. DL9XJH110 TaxID=3386643 RepID=UPI003BB55F03